MDQLPADLQMLGDGAFAQSLLVQDADLLRASETVRAADLAALLRCREEPGCGVGKARGAGRLLILSSRLTGHHIDRGRGRRRGWAALLLHGQAVLMASEKSLKRLAQIDEQMIPVRTLPGTRSASFGAFRGAACAVTTDQSDTVMPAQKAGLPWWLPDPAGHPPGNELGDPPTGYRSARPFSRQNRRD